MRTVWRLRTRWRVASLLAALAGGAGGLALSATILREALVSDRPIVAVDLVQLVILVAGAALIPGWLVRSLDRAALHRHREERRW